MNNFIFENATKVYFGKGCVKEYLSCLLKPYNTVMLAYGGGSVKRNGIYDEVSDILNKTGKNVVEFSGITANVTCAKVLEGAGIAREYQAELILGVGGGSVADCCKAISIAARYDGDVWADFWERPGIFNFEPLPVGVIATTAAGSMCNGSAVVTNERLKVKTGRDYPKCNPKFALMDPVYTYSMSEKQMISGGFAIFSHIMESYFGRPDEGDVSDDLSEALMCGVIRDLRAAMRNPQDYTARSNLMWESAMAENRIIRLGRQVDCVCRRMEYQLEAYTNCNHGEGYAVLYPVYCRHIYKDRTAKLRKFAADVWGIPTEGKKDEELALAGAEAPAGFVRELGMPASLCKLGGCKEEDLKTIADSCDLSCGNCGGITHEKILEIFRECYSPEGHDPFLRRTAGRHR